METTTILNWLFLPLASPSLRDRVEAVAAVAVLVTIRSTAAQLQPPTQYQRTQHSLSYLEETKIATRYFPCRSSYRHQTAVNRQADPQPLAHRRAQYQSKADSQPNHEVNLPQHDSDDTQKRARPDDRPTKTSLLHHLTRQMLRTLLCYLIQGDLWNAKRLSGHATLPFHRL
jgi:hypothetical protein